MNYGRHDINPFSFTEYEYGLNTTLKSSDIGELYFQRYPKHYCIKCNNVVLDQMKHRSGTRALNSNVSGRIWGMDFYKPDSGEDTLLTAIGQKLYSVDINTGTLTELYDFGSVGETYCNTWLNKCWVTNGTKLIKIENNIAYQVAIEPPIGVTATHFAGGTLPNGVYKLFAGYARTDGSNNLLFSRGQSIASVTLGGGNNTIAIANFANSTDPQVGNKVIWATDADLDAYFLYYQTNNNTTTSFNITSSAGKKPEFPYEVYAATNYVPSDFEYIHCFDRRLWGSVGNTLFYSLQEGNIYDLERFDMEANLIIFPYAIHGIFSLNGFLYLNTKAGLIKQAPDPFARYDIIGAGTLNPNYFLFPRTVSSDGQNLIGVTNNGFNIFDGEKWYSNDFSKNIKPEFSILNAGTSNNNQPCGAIVHKENRIEYHLAYRNKSLSTDMNNSRLVLNMSTMQIFDKEEFMASWESWDISANYMAVNSNNTLYCAQSNDTKSVIYKDENVVSKDINVYIKDTFYTERIIPLLIRSGTFTPDMAGKTTFENARILAHFNRPFNVKIQIVSNREYNAANAVIPKPSVATQGFILGVSRLNVDYLGSLVDEPTKIKIPKTSGYSFYVEIEQTEEDKNWQLLKLLLYGYITKGRFL